MASSSKIWPATVARASGPGWRRHNGQMPVPLPEAAAQETQAINTHDLFVWRLGEVHQALEPLRVTGRLTAVVAARSTLETALELLTTLPHAAIPTLVQQLRTHLEALLAPLAGLEQTLAPHRQDLDPANETTILWVWRHRQALALAPGEGFPGSLAGHCTGFVDRVELLPIVRPACGRVLA